MKQLRTQQHSHHNSKAWTSLDCLVTSFPIAPLTRSSIIMRSNGNIHMTDSRRVSPQTTSSSGYHSDLSSATPANQSPQSIHESLPTTFEKSSVCSSSSQLHKTTNSTYEKILANKNLSRISSFIRKQYERAKAKFTSKTSLPSQIQTPTVTTCSKATSTTPLAHLSADTSMLTSKQQHSTCNRKLNYHEMYLPSVYEQHSFTEPVYAIDLHQSRNHEVTLIASHQHKNYSSIHDCYSHLPSYRYSTKIDSQLCSSSQRRLAAMANFENHNYNLHLHRYYPAETLPSLSCQTYYPYRYTNNNYDYHRSNYVPLSDFISTKASAFKPIGHKHNKQLYQRPKYNTYEQVPPSDDPCDLEVAQYFPQTSHWSNPNYFDIYSKDTNLSKQNYTETLC